MDAYSFFPQTEIRISTYLYLSGCIQLHIAALFDRIRQVAQQIKQKFEVIDVSQHTQLVEVERLLVQLDIDQIF